MLKTRPLLGLQAITQDTDFKGLKPFKPVIKWLDKALLFERLNGYLNSFDRSLDYADFCKLSRDYFAYHYTDEDNFSQRVPANGPCVVVANHPTGFAETMMVPELIFKKRKDLKILSNEMLTALPYAQPYLIPIDVYNKKSSMRSIRECSKWLAQGGVLLIFPAGEISDFSRKSSRARDIPWSSLPVSLAKRNNAQLIHAHVFGQNSKLFYLTSRLNRTARVMWLSRELYNKKRVNFSIHCSEPISINHYKDDDNSQLSRYLYSLNYALRSRSYFDDVKVLETPSEDCPSLSVELPCMLAAEKELDSLSAEHVLYQLKHYVVYAAKGCEIPKILNLIQYARERTFRAVGMGTGCDKDSDEFDNQAYHLFVWDKKKSSLVGAYRYQIIDQDSPLSYLSKFYQIDQASLSAMGACLECSRSFIMAEYQKSFIGLLCLWRGLAKVVIRHENVRFLAGLVSISAACLPKKLLDLVVLYTQAMADEQPTLAACFESRKSYEINSNIPFEIVEATKQCRTVSQLENVFYQLTGVKYSLPILFSKYESLGLHPLKVTLDPDFSGCVDVLEVWDIKHCIPNKIRLFFEQQDINSLVSRFNCAE